MSYRILNNQTGEFSNADNSGEEICEMSAKLRLEHKFQDLDVRRTLIMLVDAFAPGQ